MDEIVKKTYRAKTDFVATIYKIYYDSLVEAGLPPLVAGDMVRDYHLFMINSYVTSSMEQERIVSDFFGHDDYEA